jgi:hypothetical protein
MNDETKRILQQSVRVLKSNGGMSDKEMRPVILNIERLIKKRRPGKRVKRA